MQATTAGWGSRHGDRFALGGIELMEHLVAGTPERIDGASGG
jgi:hypothetical protein